LPPEENRRELIVLLLSGGRQIAACIMAGSVSKYSSEVKIEMLYIVRQTELGLADTVTRMGEHRCLQALTRQRNSSSAAARSTAKTMLPAPMLLL